MITLNLVPHESTLIGTTMRECPGNYITRTSFGVTLPDMYGRLDSDSAGSYNVGDMENWLSDLGFVEVGDGWQREVESFQIAMGAKEDTISVVGVLYFDIDGTTYYIYGMGISALNISK